MGFYLLSQLLACVRDAHPLVHEQPMLTRSCCQTCRLMALASGGYRSFKLLKQSPPGMRVSGDAARELLMYWYDRVNASSLMSPL